MMHPRWFARLYAFAFGYFWLPCPLCGKMFGGMEWGPGRALPTGEGVCPRLACVLEAQHRMDDYLNSPAYREQFRRMAEALALNPQEWLCRQIDAQAHPEKYPLP